LQRQCVICRGNISRAGLPRFRIGLASALGLILHRMTEP
jgi:hypothetical protein